MLTLPRPLRAVLKPQVILPLLLAAALLAFAISLGDVHQVVARVRNLPMPVLWISLAAAAGYLACKAVQLRLMLRQINVAIPARSFWLAFAVGELTVTLPLGMFSQNWVLSASREIAIGRSAAATVMMVLAEIAVVFLFLAVTGIPGWPGTRPLCIAVLAILALLLVALVIYERHARAVSSRLRNRTLRQGVSALLETLRGLRRLSTPLMLTISIALAAMYLGALTLAFWQVGRGMDAHHLDYLTAATIYAFSLAVILVGAGIFSQIGTLELLGMLAARAWDIDYTDGLAMMLGFRIVWTASIWLLCLPIVAALWREMPRRASTSVNRGKVDSSKEVQR
jgi:hypothetical protein